jgi:hypothetical protein
MKKLTLIIFLVCISFATFSQTKGNAQTGGKQKEIKKIKPNESLLSAPENKAVVYFVRPSVLGVAINFSYFDSASVIGKFNGRKYLRYECDPGNHLFWARSENRDFVKANLEKGKVYFIEAIPTMGALKARVVLNPLDPRDAARMNSVFKLLNKKPSESFTAEALEIENQNLKAVIENGLEKYRKDKQQGIPDKKLAETMCYNN